MQLLTCWNRKEWRRRARGKVAGRRAIPAGSADPGFFCRKKKSLFYRNNVWFFRLEMGEEV
jgi:hypothetical protein